MDLQKLILESQCIVKSGDEDRIKRAFDQILSGTKDHRFWSATLIETTPRSAIALFPAQLSEAGQIFPKGLDAIHMVTLLREIMQKLVGGKLRYIPSSELPVQGFEIRLGEKCHPGEREGLPVALVFAAMCPAR